MLKILNKSLFLFHEERKLRLGFGPKISSDTQSVGKCRCVYDRSKMSKGKGLRAKRSKTKRSKCKNI